ncbi:MAG: DNA polymerase [Pseudomonadota bacterium]|nr:DNA polymerase [Pseudomonadota bacterium]
MKNILAEATIEEDLPTDFGIYDLNQFLNGLGLHQNPDLDFENEGHVVIREGRSRTKYFFADPNVIVTPPDKEITLPSEDVSFELSTSHLDKLLKAAAIYQLTDLAVVGGDGVVKIVVRDKKNDTSNDFSIVVGETESTFSFNFKVENIKILPGTYDVVVSQKLLSRFTCRDYDLTYYIALEPDSTFG